MHMNNMKMLINDKFEILILKFFIKYLFLMLINISLSSKIKNSFERNIIISTELYVIYFYYF